ncbi:MAG: rhamnulokinase [Anaerolineae bacterium]|nr:rhamnulokinase [Anaerolineae bacterium]
MTTKNVLAIDLGAESGRVLRVSFDGKRFAMEDVHRFPNTPVTAGGTFYWDVLRLWHDIQTGIQQSKTDVGSIGIDTWGVDFALLDRDGRLLSNPVHYRDSRTEGMMDWVFERVPRRQIFERTGIQFIMLNTLYQVASLVKNQSPLLECAATLLTIPDLLNYWLTGVLSCEFTLATTTQFFNPRTNDWDYDTLQAIGIPTNILTPIVQPGTRIGSYEGIPVIAPACHDTGSAVVAVPTTTENYAYLSSGTWSLIGLELTEPVISDESYAANVTNEGGVYGTYRFLKNVMGLWLAQQCRVTWHAEGKDYSYNDLTRLAASADPFVSLIDPDDPRFLPPGDMPARIREFCSQTGQPVPQTDAEVIRIVYESLALKYRYVLDKMAEITGKPIDRLHIIGGGSQNKLLNQMTASAIGRTVITGPVEATALGNAIVQFISLGEIADLGQARAILSETLDTEHYEPGDQSAWEDAFIRFTTLVETNA